MQEECDLQELTSHRCPVCGYSNFVTDGEVTICINCQWTNVVSMFDELPDWDEPTEIGWCNDWDDFD